MIGSRTRRAVVDENQIRCDRYYYTCDATLQRRQINATWIDNLFRNINASESRRRVDVPVLFGHGAPTAVRDML